MSQPSEMRVGEKAEPPAIHGSQPRIAFIAGTVGLALIALIAIVGYSYRTATPPTAKFGSTPPAGFVDVVGGVKAPQRVEYEPSLTIESAIRKAGGFTEYADTKKVRLLRSGTVSIVDVRSLRRNPLRDIRIEPGDQILVPEILW